MRRIFYISKIYPEHISSKLSSSLREARYIEKFYVLILFTEIDKISSCWVNDGSTLLYNGMAQCRSSVRLPVQQVHALYHFNHSLILRYSLHRFSHSLSHLSLLTLLATLLVALVNRTIILPRLLSKYNYHSLTPSLTHISGLFHELAY